MHCMLLNVSRITNVHKAILLKIIVFGGFAMVFYLEGGEHIPLKC